MNYQNNTDDIGGLVMSESRKKMLAEKISWKNISYLLQGNNKPLMTIVIMDFIRKFTILVTQMNYVSLEEITSCDWSEFQLRIQHILDSGDTYDIEILQYCQTIKDQVSLKSQEKIKCRDKGLNILPYSSYYCIGENEQRT